MIRASRLALIANQKEIGMSYDLFFRARSPGRTISQEKFASFFAKRRCYEVKETQAWYSNENTGVYFSFDFKTPGEELEDEHGSSLLPVSFNLNYYRPHPFGLEAEPEVAAFVEHFDVTVSDPQNSEMGDGEYTKDGFLQGWNAGNEFGYGAILSQEPEKKVMTQPSDMIESYWRWNYGIEARYAEIGVDAFVPRVFYFDLEGRVATGVAWGDAIPILLPKVDLVLSPRDRLAPRRLLGSAKKDIVVFAWHELDAILKQYSKMPGDPICYQLYYAKPPGHIGKLFRSKQPPNDLPKSIAFDEILNQELVEKCRPTKINP